MLESNGVVTMVAALVGCFGALGYSAIEYSRDVDPRAISLHLNLAILLAGLVLIALDPPASDAWSSMGGETLLLFVGAGFFGTLYQILATRAVQLLGAATGAAVGLTTAVFAWAIDILVWPEHILPLRLVGLALALMPALWAVAFASLQRPRDGSPGGSAASR